jgi:hypothetical protein
VRATASRCDYRRSPDESGYVTGDDVLATYSLRVVPPDVSPIGVLIQPLRIPSVSPGRVEKGIRWGPKRAIYGLPGGGGE